MCASHPLRQFTVKVKSGATSEEITVLAARSGDALAIASRAFADEDCAAPPCGIGLYARPLTLLEAA